MARANGPVRPDDRVQYIHAGAGLRQDHLHEALGVELRRIWRVAEDETPAEVRAIVVLRLKNVLDSMADLRLPEIVWTAYNLGAGTAAHDGGIIHRLDRLGGAKRKGMSGPTCTRLFYGFLATLRESLGKEQECVLSAEDLALATAWLNADVRPPGLSAGLSAGMAVGAQRSRAWQSRFEPA
ncbi:hypothetical protein [Amycolatopsis sp. H20-H5]|uniref:hypothetical protein n=1 Tax=Amycolatopsis sp. H20-H5 TaxID=3046309 RepID=UPI002DBA3D60|nr:hypothetical protein [Amycolatopsis sp. H20-H5]MEC3980348.1 hypothetical protein [Amycolatopsis sp. H20-H5]